MEQDLVDALLAFPGLAELVGEQIDWNNRPQGQTGYAITLRRTSSPPEYTLQGRRGLTRTLVTMDVDGPDLPGVAAVTAQLRLALDTLRTAPFQGAIIENERDSFILGDGPVADEASDSQRTSLDVRVWHVA